MKNLARLLSLAGGLLLSWGALSADLPRVGYVAINVADEKRSMDFYVGLLGMELRERVSAPTLSETALQFGKDERDTGVLLVHRTDRAKPYDVGDGFSRTIINVANIEAVMKRLADAGVKVVKPITELPNMKTNWRTLKLKYAMVKDPDDYTVELVQFE
jgi:catechol 2,3-dioxygenase-like lactoylglutathione lyase family enzyme